MSPYNRLKKGQKLGKYRLIRHLGEGGFGEVWKAKDLVEGIDVAVKIPQPQWMTKEHHQIFQDEVKLVASLDHHNILKIKNADTLGKYFVIVTECGKEALSDRMVRAKSPKFIMSIIGQVLSALSYAHRHKVIHRDIKPENVILFKDGTARLTDFGIAKIVDRTFVRGEGTGTIGYMAPEQAYGQAYFSSDVFSVGILFYQLLANELPPWPFEWPYPKCRALSRRVPRAILNLIKKATTFNPVKRYPNAMVMEQAWERAVKHWKQFLAGNRKKQRKTRMLHWRDYKVHAFVRLHHAKLRLDFLCRKCEQPISEFMSVCPWCGDTENSFRYVTTLPDYCERCYHGIHSDWRFCPWCYREGFKKYSNEQSRDPRYITNCTNPHCRHPLLMFMRYCPYCHKKTTRAWQHPTLPDKCPSCRWGVAKDYWDFCSWCGYKLG